MLGLGIRPIKQESAKKGVVFSAFINKAGWSGEE
jgi:hypothetical protein